MTLALASDACFALGVFVGTVGTLCIVAGVTLWLALTEGAAEEEAQWPVAEGAAR